MKILELPERRSLADMIHDNLERMILSGELKPGEAVNEKALSVQNGLSRAPIREACRRLEQAGLVEIVVNRGVFVRKISRQAAAELCEIRILLAGRAARLTATRITEAETRQLVVLMEEIEQAIDEGRLSDFYALNGHFHTKIIEASGNRRLREIYEAINKELNLFRWRALRTSADLEEVLTAHRAIIATLLARDVDGFVAAVEAHLGNANRRLLEAGIDNQAAAQSNTDHHTS